ncbi:hypothetical protein HK102_005339, partial [Quaeritorhiza haematococci]
RLLSKLQSDTDLAAQLNKVYPKRGLFKDAALKEGARKEIDQKITLDLSDPRLRAILENEPALVQRLGPDFREAVGFYHAVERRMIDRLLVVLGKVTGKDLTSIHTEKNYNYRLVDYFPRLANGIPSLSGATTASDQAHRCNEHRDYGTFTIIFQDGQTSGLEVKINGKYEHVPPTDASRVILLFGWCAAIMTNDRIKAALHRVVDPAPANGLVVPRRNAAVFFVAPDKGAQLVPSVLPGETRQYWWKGTVGDLKEIIGNKWRIREGTEIGGETDEEGLNLKTQDDVINHFLRAVPARF